jgi:hypothetical protein
METLSTELIRDLLFVLFGKWRQETGIQMPYILFNRKERYMKEAIEIISTHEVRVRELMAPYM